MLRPYFELSRVKDGVFGLATKLYGITFKENPDIPVYHPDVTAYEVYDKDGNVVVTKLNEAMCRELAAAGNGAYFYVDNTNAAEKALAASRASREAYYRL